jgi:hypothetical protein
MDNFYYETEAQMHVGAIEAGWSSTEDPETCACHGGGWILSQLDSWHACPVHHVKGQRHPEDGYDDAPMGSEPPDAEGGPTGASYPEEPTCTCGGLCRAGTGCYAIPF